MGRANTFFMGSGVVRARPIGIAAALARSIVPLGCVVDDGAGDDSGSGANSGAESGGVGGVATEKTLNTCSATGVVLKGTYTGDLKLTCATYILRDDVVFKKGSLLINPGVAFVADKDASFWVESDGALVAKGTPKRGNRVPWLEGGRWTLVRPETSSSSEALRRKLTRRGLA